ncbi:alpha/beta fold hydrolase [Flavihumibacter fluvii]|uniref:alpha/beta fold hydrolase n=1 Tax=Flavihumibacter fluvii TaxID=2838157 RepID=UPI001BDF6DE7|nr:alpha/beta hydrolase [Flavihumibacter fluvii]ULQ51726.1 alpha/beta hydrolase [Flavihumibacter fluvii]
MSKMKNVKWMLRWTLLFTLLIFLYQLFCPRHYNVQLREGEINTELWQLRTGSTIGFTRIPSGSKEHQAYPIIYLHGGPGGAISKRVIDDLKPLSNFGFDMYFYDQVGSGNSSRLSNILEYTVQRHIDDLDEIIKNTNSKKVILIAQSWGSVLAAAYLSQHPETIDKIVFTSPGPIYPINRAEINIPAPDSIKIRTPLYTNREANTSSSNIHISTIKFIATRFGKKIASDKEVDEFADFLDSKTYKSALCDTSINLPNRGGNGYFAGIMTYKSLLLLKDFRTKIKGMKIPVLVMKGECDNQPWGATNEYLNLFPDHKISLVPNAGHFINVEQNEIYIREMKDFLLH